MILKELEIHTGTFPRKAVEEAIARREEMIPHLLEVLEYTVENAEALLERDEYMAHLYAMYLLAQFREKRAYPLIMKFLSIPGDTAAELIGGTVTEGLKNILASVSCGDTSLIIELAENEEANEYVRGAALESLLVLVVCGERSREEVLDYYKSLFRGKLKREPQHVWGVLIYCCTRLCPEEVYEDIKQVYEEDLADPFYVDLDYVNEAMAAGKEKMLAELRADRFNLIEDTVAEMHWWAAFKQPETRSSVAFKQPEQSSIALPAARFESNTLSPEVEKPQPYRAEKKIGRNQPCPCGSGKKYKKCCGK
ncbi:MAG: DUF1186 domain-containing protein [Blastocatellia bacterium]|nr:DUF1186 domain-containing protein [Blastocatellia bacterium]